MIRADSRGRFLVGLLAVVVLSLFLTAGRLGGDEFPIVLAETELEAAQRVIDGLKPRIHEAEIQVSDDLRISPRVSIGLAPCPGGSRKKVLVVAPRYLHRSAIVRSSASDSNLALTRSPRDRMI